MGVKRHRDRWQVDLRGVYVKLVDDEGTARLLEQHGRYLLALGKPLQEVRSELRGGARAAAPTFGEYSERWLAAAGDVRADTVSKYRQRIGYFDQLSGRALTEITPDDVRDVVGALVKRKLAPKTIKDSLALFRAIMLQAVDSGIIERSPAARVTNVPKSRKTREPVVLTREQYRAIVVAAPIEHRPLFALLPLLGLRLGEFVALGWKDVEADRIVVRRQWDGHRLRAVKGRRDGQHDAIDLFADARRWLEVQRGQTSGPLVFPGPNGYMSRTHVYERVFQPVRDATGLHFRPHDLRHTCGSWLLDAGYSLAYVQRHLRHRSLDTTVRHYLHQIEEHDEGVAAAFDRWLSGDIVGTDGDA